MHYSRTLSVMCFGLFKSTTGMVKQRRTEVAYKIDVLEKTLVARALKELKKHADLMKKEKNEFIPIQICIKDTITKVKI